MPLQGEQTLLWSTVIANCRMNRERGLLGVNSYAKELKSDLFAWLAEQARQKEAVYWLDICCGTGKALVEAARLLQENGMPHVQIEGWDMAGLFVAECASYPNLRLIANTISHWQPAHPYDLITCVHGLHYIGDKLGLIRKCAANLTPGGLFIGNLDLKNIKKLDGTSLERPLRKSIQHAGLHYHSRQHLLTCHGPKSISFNLSYAGANDQAGKNYTGQEVVDSYFS